LFFIALFIGSLLLALQRCLPTGKTRKESSMRFEERLLQPEFGGNGCATKPLTPKKWFLGCILRLEVEPHVCAVVWKKGKSKVYKSPRWLFRRPGDEHYIQYVVIREMPTVVQATGVYTVAGSGEDRWEASPSAELKYKVKDPIPVTSATHPAEILAAVVQRALAEYVSGRRASEIEGCEKKMREHLHKELQKATEISYFAVNVISAYPNIQKPDFHPERTRAQAQLDDEVARIGIKREEEQKQKELLRERELEGQRHRQQLELEESKGQFALRQKQIEAVTTISAEVVRAAGGPEYSREGKETVDKITELLPAIGRMYSVDGQPRMIDQPARSVSRRQTEESKIQELAKSHTKDGRYSITAIGDQITDVTMTLLSGDTIELTCGDGYPDTPPSIKLNGKLIQEVPWAPGRYIVDAITCVLAGHPKTRLNSTDG
jgi:hypothetical protein